MGGVPWNVNKLPFLVYPQGFHQVFRPIPQLQRAGQMAEQGPHDSPVIYYIPLVGYDLLEETPRWTQYRPYSQPTARTTTCIHPTPDPTTNTRRLL
ncbi:hypothetical protein [Absidia glauca]|uniref:Uncharacterized protein n=1 Tax=Absidia glauca TaxID=4829 RepID=A0A163IY03_ABSGL|nr:hypothetical protein [Absidia glauca]